MADGPRVAVVGASIQQIDGVRDHATALATALRAEGVPCTDHWLSLGEARPSRGPRLRDWTRTLPAEIGAGGAQAVLFHYSAFTYYQRGLPLLVHPVVTALRACGLPVITFMHEFVYPWGSGRLKGIVWALADRAALRELVCASSAMIATTDARLDWLRSRRWLPRRAASLAPVFSNLPPPAAGMSRERGAPVVGLFGYYALDRVSASLILDVVSGLRERGVGLELLLAGSPARAPAAGDTWSRAAGARGLTHAVSFTGTLPAQELSDALAGCDLLLYANLAGPVSSKGTLAASLASGRPVIALEGRQRWQQLLEAGAARVVPRSADALASALAELLQDPPEREALGARGRAFAATNMGVARTAAAVVGLLGQVLGPNGEAQPRRVADQ